MTYVSEVLADAPWGYWKFAEASGATVADSSGNGRDLTLGGTYTRNAAGMRGRLGVATTMGANSYANGTMTDLAMDGSWTLECWYKPTNWGTAGQRNGIFQIGTVTGGSDGIWSWRHGNTGGVVGEFGVVRNNTTQVIATTITGTVNNLPQHLVLTYDGTTMKMYRNGVQVSSDAVSDLNPGNVDFRWNWERDAARSSTGEIQHAAIYPSALSQARVTAHYNAALSYSEHVLADSPRIFYPVNERTGSTCTDASGNSRNGTFVGTSYPDAIGHSVERQGARWFDSGSADRIEYGTGWTAADFTVEYWLYPTAAAVNYGFYATSQASWGSGGFIISADSSGNFYAGTDLASRAVLGSFWTTSAWMHIVVTLSGTTGKVYKNGVEVYSGTWAAASAHSYLYVGQGQGVFQDVAVYDTALSAARVAAHYDAGYDPEVKASLRAWWKFDETSGIFAADSSGTINTQHALPKTGTIAQLGTGLASGGSTKSLDFQSARMYTPVQPRLAPVRNKWTLACWFKADTTPSSSMGLISAAYVGLQDQIAFWLGFDREGTAGAGKLGVGRYSGGWENVHDSVAISTGVTYFVAATCDTDTGDLLLYKDGSLVASGTVSGTLLASNPPEVYLGGRWDNALTFDGVIDDAAIWDVALSASDIASLYADMSKVPLAPGIVTASIRPFRRLKRPIARSANARAVR